MAKETAESKLLKLIEETDAKDKAGAPAPAAAPAAAQVTSVLSSVTSVGVSTIPLPPFLAQLLTFWSRGTQSSSGFGLRLVNIVLVILIMILGICFFNDFSNGAKQAETNVVFKVKEVPADGQAVALPTVLDVADYVASISSRNIFRPFEKKVEEAKIIVPLENQQIKDKLANFKLVGISWLNSPDTATAMIEDKARAITLFIKAGDDLSKSSENLKGVNLDVIYADRVEFSFQGEKLMMNL